MRLPLLFVLGTVLVNAMGVGLAIPVMPDLLRDVSGGGLAEAALWGGVLSTVFAAMQFLFAPLLGALSDRYGRRPVLLVSIAVTALDYVVMALAPSLWLLVAARVVGGVTSATQATASAWIADTAEPGRKAQGFGLIGAAFGLGFVLGPLLGGLLGEWGTRAPFWAAAALALANLALGSVAMTETVTDAIRRPFEPARANPFGALRALGRLPGIGRGLAIWFLAQVAFAVYPAIWAFFGQARFGWDAGTIGLSLALFGAMMALVQGGLIRVVLPLLGARRTVILGFGFDLLAFGLIAVIRSGPVVLALVPMAALGALAGPALHGLMSQSAGPQRQGELQGALTSVNAVAMVLSPLLMTAVFAAFTGPGAPVALPGAPFLLSMLLIAAALGLLLMPARDRSVA